MVLTQGTQRIQPGLTDPSYSIHSIPTYSLLFWYTPLFLGNRRRMHAHLDTFTADWMIWIIRCIEWCKLLKPLSCKLIYSTNSIRAERSKLIKGFNDNANRCYSNTPSPGNLRRIHSVFILIHLSRTEWFGLFNALDIASHSNNWIII